MHILFEDEFIIAVQKPSGIPSHSLPSSEKENSTALLTEPSVESILSRTLAPKPVFLVHRLDTGTSGVLVFAKDENTFNAMRELFRKKEIKKHYLAWTPFSLEKELKLKKMKFPLFINLPLAHHPKSKKRMIALPEGKKISHRGKPIPAISILHDWKKVDFFNHPTLEISLEIVTGVMHQIRVHLKHFGFPLIGDLIYHTPHSSENPIQTEPLTVRMGLHAKKIEFNLNGKRYSIEAPVFTGN